MDKTTRIELMAHGRIGKALFSLSAPAVAGMVVMAVYNVADTFFISLLRDTTAVAATGIVFPLFQLIGSIGLTFGMGAASVISRNLGAEDYRGAREVGATALYSAAAAGILFSVGGTIFIEPLLILFGATDSILEAATLYGRIIIGGSVFPVWNMCINNLLRSEGASGHSSFGQILGAVLNIVLDPIFIFALDMGITGAAAATVISQAVSAAYLSGFYLLGKGYMNPLTWSWVRPVPRIYRQLMTLGIPTFVRQILGSISFAMLNTAAAAYGDAAIAAVSITLRLFMLLLMGLIGIAQGLQPLAGYNYGARQFARVHAVIRTVFMTSIVICFTAGILGFLFAPQIISIFAPHDQEVLNMGVLSIRMMAVSLIPVGLVIMFGGIFQALGDGRSALILAAGQQGLFLIPLILVLPRLFGLPGIFAAMPSGFIFAFIIGLMLFIRTVSRLKSMEQTYPQ